MNNILKASESEEQIALFEWANLQLGMYPELILMYHVPNEGKRSLSYGSRLKKEGLKSGVPDIVLPVARGRYHGLYIEMKAVGGTLTKNQKAWLKALHEQGYFTMACIGWECAAQQIKKYLSMCNHSKYMEEYNLKLECREENTNGQI